MKGEASPCYGAGDDVVATAEAMTIMVASTVTFSPQVVVTPKAITVWPPSLSTQDKGQSPAENSSWLSKLGSGVDYLLGGILVSDLDTLKALTPSALHREKLFYSTKVKISCLLLIYYYYFLLTRWRPCKPWP